MSARPGAPARFVGIDMLKGCAILWVMLIHAEALRGHAVFTHLVNHAVGIFVVLFGLNSVLWWRGRELRSDLGRWRAELGPAEQEEASALYRDVLRLLREEGVTSAPPDRMVETSYGAGGSEEANPLDPWWHVSAGAGERQPASDS